jgi:class 3 adenylate cyclase
VTVIEAAVVNPAAGTHTGHMRFYQRRISAVLFTDIVGSAAHAHRLGDRAWCALLEEHDELVRSALDDHEGREIDASDDGFFAAFDGASSAIACAFAIREALAPIGLEVRSGVHAGEFEDRGTRLGGIAVAVGARIAGLAADGEVLVSRTVRDLVLGSGVRFLDRGLHSLKGVPGDWRLYAAQPIGFD